MKSIRPFLFIFSVLLFCETAAAQVDFQNLPDSLFGITITVKPKGILYLPNEEQARRIHDASVRNIYYTFTVNPSYCKTKKVSKQTELQVLGFIKTNADIDFDLYTVLFKGKLYYVHPDDVIDNYLIEDKNSRIRQWYAKLLCERDSLKKEYDALFDAKLHEVQSGKLALNSKESRVNDVSQALFMQRLSEKMTPMLEKYQAWYDNLEPSAKQAADLISIQRARLDTPNSAGGCDFGLEFTNMSQKSIKYLDWYGNVYNAVNDKVACTIRNTYSFSGRVTGPLEYKQQFGGNWDSIIYNYSARELRFTKAVITYIDGSKKTLSGSALNAIIGAPICSLHSWDVDYIERHAKEDAENQIRRERRLWEEREACLSAIDQRTDPPSSDIPFFDALFSLKKQLAAKEEEVAKFEDRNFIRK